MGFLSTLRRDVKGGTSAYKTYNRERNKWVESQIGPQPQGLFIEGERVSGDADAIYSLEVMAGDSYTVSELQTNCGWMNDQSGFTVETFYFD